MCDKNGLGALQVRVAGHDRVGVGLGLREKSVLKRAKPPYGIVDGLPQKQAYVQCNLVVTGTCGVKPPRRFPDELGQPGLDIHVNVFQFFPKRKSPGLYLPLYGIEALAYSLNLRLRHNPLPSKHPRMRL